MFRRFSFSLSPVLLLLTMVVTLGLSGCYNVPVTGRNSVSLVDDKDINAKSAAEFERSKKMHKLSRNPAQIKIVNHIGMRLSKTVFWDVPLADWEFVVFDAPSVLNAFAMPGGKVAVFSGLIDFCENEDQLASVIAHEIAHVAARHTHERFSQGMLLSPLGAATSIGIGGAISGVGVYMPSVGSAVGGATTTVTQLAFDRGKELEADHIGLMYMAKAGYDPREAMKLLERMEEREATSGVTGPPGWMANHPGFPQRQIQLMELMDEAMKLYENGESGGTHTIIE